MSDLFIYFPILIHVLILARIFIFLQYLPILYASAYFFLFLLSPFHMNVFPYHLLALI